MKQNLKSGIFTESSNLWFISQKPNKLNLKNIILLIQNYYVIKINL